MSEQKPYIGGQAVIEGVMMRAPGCMSVACRKPDGSIAIVEGPMISGLAGSKVWKWPLFRGVATLVESLKLGYRALHFSAEQQMSDEEKAEAGGSSGKMAMVISIVFALLLFVALPQLAASGTGSLFGLDLDLQGWQFHAVTGGFKLLVFTIYLGVISQLRDVKRVFQYHGAEHKTIFAYEAGLPLTVENVRKQSTLHPRCGTTFLIVVILVSIVAGSIFTPLLLPEVGGTEEWILTLAIRISLLPLIAAVSYELQRFSAKYCTTGPLQVLLWPGFLFQKITTREPDDHQIEIAIAAMQTAMWRERIGEGAHIDEAPLLFPSFESFLAGVDELRPVKVPVAA